MVESNKTYIKTLPRHNRIVIFIDDGVKEQVLRNIMDANLHVWGGRYNPIIPVSNNIVSDEWLNVLKHFDPDYVYYSKKINLQTLKTLNVFQPKDYVEFDDENNHFNLNGLNIHSLLYRHVQSNLNDTKLTLLHYGGNWDMPLIAKDFYRLNFGFKALYVGENKWTSKYETVSIDKQNVDEINKFIYEKNSYFKSLLSTRHINSVHLITNAYWQLQQLEWVIYNPQNYLSDLLYFWNRQLYLEPSNRIQQVISTTDELEQLLSDKFFEGLLYRISVSNCATFVSRSINSETLQEIQRKVQLKTQNVTVLSKTVNDFPFQVHRAEYTSSKYLLASNNLLFGKKDFLKFPVLLFEDGDSIDNGDYVMDIRIERDNTDEHKEIKFPYATSLFHLVCKENLRINKEHRISIFLNKEKQGTEISIPTDVELIRGCLMFKEMQNNFVDLPIQNVYLSTYGQKLRAFFNLFDKDWFTIQQFLEEKFWLQLFRNESDVDKSAIPIGKGVFSHKDLEKEIEALFEKYKEEIAKDVRIGAEESLDDDTIQRFIERSKIEAFEYYIDPNLQFLIENNGLFLGMKVSCKHCGSNKWYSLHELSNRFKCKGCINEITPNIRSSVYYKLSETITNNLLSDQTKNAKHYDGNYVVLKTLLHFKQDFSNYGNSFIWSPPLNFTAKSAAKEWSSDLDILLIQNGNLIVGEAKARSDMFNTKEIKNLAWVADNLMPDKVIVACNTGNLDNTVKKINALKTNQNCEVISYVASKPWYHFRGLFGLPKNSNLSSRSEN